MDEYRAIVVGVVVTLVIAALFGPEFLTGALAGLALTLSIYRILLALEPEHER